MPDDVHKIAVGVDDDAVTLSVDDIVVHIPWRGAMEIGGVMVACAIEVADSMGIPEPGIQAALDQAGARVEGLVGDEVLDNVREIRDGQRGAGDE